MNLNLNNWGIFLTSKLLCPHLDNFLDGCLSSLLVPAGEDHSGPPPGQVHGRGLTDAGVCSWRRMTESRREDLLKSCLRRGSTVNLPVWSWLEKSRKLWLDFYESLDMNEARDRSVCPLSPSGLTFDLWLHWWSDSENRVFVFVSFHFEIALVYFGRTVELVLYILDLGNIWKQLILIFCGRYFWTLQWAAVVKNDISISNPEPLIWTRLFYLHCSFDGWNSWTKFKHSDTFHNLNGFQKDFKPSDIFPVKYIISIIIIISYHYYQYHSYLWFCVLSWKQQFPVCAC